MKTTILALAAIVTLCVAPAFAADAPKPKEPTPAELKTQVDDLKGQVAKLQDQLEEASAEGVVLRQQRIQAQAAADDAVAMSNAAQLRAQAVAQRKAQADAKASVTAPSK